jgi:hypothetical protein
MPVEPQLVRHWTIRIDDPHLTGPVWRADRSSTPKQYS